MNPSAGILVLLLALWLLLAYFSGRLEWLFSLRDVAREPAGPGEPVAAPRWALGLSLGRRPSTVYRRG